MRVQAAGPRLALGLICAALVATACGSTVQQTGTAPVDQGLGGSTSGTPGTGDVLAPDGTTGSNDTSTVSSTGAGASSGTGSGVGTGGSGTGAGGSSTGAATTGTTTAPRRSTTLTRPITVGVVAGDPTKLAAAFGMQASNQDIFTIWKNLIAYKNKHGGLAGRQIKPIYYAIDAAAADQASAFQAACANMTQDNKVDVVLSLDISNVQGFAQCLRKKGIPQLDAGQYTTDAIDQATTPNLYTPDALAHDLFATALIKQSVARGWLTPKDRLGIVIQDCPLDNRVYNNQLVPAAKAAGVPMEKATVNCIHGNADIGTAASQISSAVLAFNSHHVTHVSLLGAPEGGALLFFTQNASQQKYYPTYLITSNAFAYSNSTGGTWPADELPKMKGIGWSPILDLGLRAPTTPRQARAQATCTTMDPTHGGAQSNSSPENITNFFYSVCDTVQLLDGLLADTRGAVGISAFSASYLRVAPKVSSAKLTGGAFASAGGRRDGAQLVTPFSYKKPGCGCFSYDGPGVSTD